MPEQPTQAPDNPAQPAPAAVLERTRLSPKWLGKTLLFLIILVVFGVWGLWDATVVYPNSGREYAENAKRLYLKASKDAGSLYGAGIADPVAAYKRLGDPDALKATRTTAADNSSREQLKALADVKLYEWLDGLDTIGQLKPEQTRIADPAQELDRLDAIWQSKTQPKPLAKYDLPVQWLFVIVGLGGGLALGVLVARVKSRSYTWDAGAQRLGLPDASSLVPADIAEFDKRKWDKFLIFLKIKPGHTPHGGREVRLDLLRYIPLEDWVLAMERTAFPEHAPPDVPPPDATPSAPQEPAPTA